jgi:hypothetical protein
MISFVEPAHDDLLSSGTLKIVYRLTVSIILIYKKMTLRHGYLKEFILRAL